MNEVSMVDLLRKRKRYADKITRTFGLKIPYHGQLRVRAVNLWWHCLTGTYKTSNGRLVYINLIATDLRSELSNEAFYGVELPPGEAALPSDLRELLAQMQDNARNRVFVYRVSAEADDKVQQGFYPVFWTLTINPVHMPDPDNPELIRGATWKNFIQNVKNLTGVAAYGSRKEALKHPTSEYFTYSAVCEGLQPGKWPHVHVVTFHRDIPDDWKLDPNRGCRLPYRQEIDPAKSMWSFGFCSPRALRHQSDIWSRMGWQWPIYAPSKKKKGPIPVAPASAIGYYLAKYQTKEKGILGWRKKMSRRLGLRKLALSMTISGAHQLRLRSETFTMLDMTRIPNGSPPKSLIRSEAMRERLLRTASKTRLLALIKCRELAAPRNKLNLLDILKPLVKKSGRTSWSTSALSELLQQALGAPSDEIYHLMDELAHGSIRKTRIGVF